MKLLILSDSLAAPRTQPESLSVDLIWPQLVRQRHGDIQVFQTSIGSATTTELVWQLQYWRGIDPDVAIMQAGLCDCLPRGLRRYELEFAKEYFDGTCFEKYVKKAARKLRGFRRIKYTSPKRFKENLAHFRRVFPRLYWIEIVPGTDAEEIRIPGHQKAIMDYNLIIREVFGERAISLEDIGESDLSIDRFHLNKKGHEKIYKKVLISALGAST